MKLGETILKYRQARGLSQEKLAERVGVSRQAVSKWEVGDAVPDTDKLIPLARTLGITVDELLGNIPEEEEKEESAEPPVYGTTGTYEYRAGPEQPEKQSGWFATHWYWLGLIPAIWGAWQLLKLIVVLVCALVYSANTVVGGVVNLTPEISVGAEEIIIPSESYNYRDFVEIMELD